MALDTDYANLPVAHQPAKPRNPRELAGMTALIAERGLRQVDLVPILGSKSYVSQILSDHRPIGKDAAAKLAEFCHVSKHTFF